MPRVKAIQETINRLNKGTLSDAEICEYVNDPVPLVRVNAINALVERAAQNPKLIDELIAAVSDPRNTFSLMGVETVAHVAVSALLRTGDDRACAVARRFVDSVQEPDRSDLIQYLESQELP
jgi:hypothetical protein